MNDSDIVFDENGAPYIVKKTLIVNRETKVIGLKEPCHFRLTPSHYKKAQKIVSKNQEDYYNESHFFRAAVLQFMKKFDDKGKRLKA